MRLSLIGMAGTGKSHWSQKLAENGFRRFCCDDLIADRLVHELKRPDGTIMEMGEWMGFPFSPRYREREERYLTCEKEVLIRVLDFLAREDHRPAERIVIDTTGSVIYTGDQALAELKRLTTVVHLATPPRVQEKMLKAYLARPGPVLWQDMFVRGTTETNEEALGHCYPKLLVTRERLYTQHADVTLDYDRRRNVDFEVGDFLKSIEEAS